MNRRPRPRSIRRRLALLAAAGLVAGLLGTSYAAEAAPSSKSSTRLMYAKSATGAAAKPLANARVSGKIFVFVRTGSASIRSVSLYLDDPTGSRKPALQDAQTPFAALPVDTSKLKAGRHSVLAVVSNGTRSADLLGRFTVARAAAGATAAAPQRVGPDLGKIVWSADFNDGNAKKGFSSFEFEGGPEATVIDDPKQGKVIKFDSPAGHKRVEQIPDVPMFTEGMVRSFQWKIYIDPNFKVPTDNWFIMTQWLDAGFTQAPLRFAIDNHDDVNLGGASTDVRTTIGKTQRGKWVTYTVFAKFAKSESEGWIEAWEDNRKTIPRKSQSTMNDQHNWMKLGVYKKPDNAATVVLMDDIKVGIPNVQ